MLWSVHTEILSTKTSCVHQEGFNKSSIVLKVKKLGERRGKGGNVCERWEEEEAPERRRLLREDLDADSLHVCVTPGPLCLLSVRRFVTVWPLKLDLDAFKHTSGHMLRALSPPTPSFPPSLLPRSQLCFSNPINIFYTHSFFFPRLLILFFLSFPLSETLHIHTAKKLKSE